MDQPIKEKNVYTVYAKWETSIHYFINFDANGGSGKMIQQEITFNKKSKIKDNNFTPPNSSDSSSYIFSGWNTNRNGSGTSYQDGEEVLNLAEIGMTVVLYAQWNQTAKQYGYIKFNANSGKGTMDNQEVEVGLYAIIETNKFTSPKYYSFDCWNTKADGTGIKYAENQQIKLNLSNNQILELFAQWKLKENVYLISSITELESIKNNNFGTSTFVLNKNLDYGGKTITPLFNKTQPFESTFDGNGFEISNFRI